MQTSGSLAEAVGRGFSIQPVTVLYMDFILYQTIAQDVH